MNNDPNNSCGMSMLGHVITYRLEDEPIMLMSHTVKHVDICR
jgi:hypothetical protein